MRIRSSCRAARLLLAALAMGVAPAAIVPLAAQEYPSEPSALFAAPRSGPAAAPAAEVTRGFSVREFEDGPTPLEAAFYDLPGLDTANILPERALLGQIGQMQANPPNTGGTGNQLYFLGLEMALSQRLQVGATWNRFADPVDMGNPADTSDLILQAGVANAKYSFFDNDSLKIAARASVGWFSFRNQFHNSRDGDGAEHIIGAVQVPMTLNVGHRGALQLHFVPGVTFLPEEINGVPLYGTLPSAGVGATLQATRRLGFFGLVNVPFGENGNTFDRLTGAPENVPIWTAGARYMVTPKAALDVFVTNGFGATPATDILAFIPEGDEPVVGVRLSYTPGWSRSYRPAYYPLRDTPPTPRERHLQFHGLTMASADTLEAGTVRLAAHGGTQSNYGASVRFSPDHNLEFGYLVEHLADDGSRPVRLTLGKKDEFRWAVAGKLRLLDQNNGHPFSLSANAEFGREWGSFFGVAYASLPVMYKLSPRLALMAEPKAAGYGGRRIYGLGVGANVELFDGLDLIGEVTPVGGDATETVWAAGARLHLDQWGWAPASVDVMATNSIGNYAAGTMIAQDEVRYSVGVSFAFDGRDLFDSLF